jgi:hypothetical protein
MMRVSFFSMLILPTILTSCCAIDRTLMLEVPALIEERSGDEGRYYFPGAPPDIPWPKSDHVYYFTQLGYKVEIVNGHVVKSEMTPAEHVHIVKTIRRLRAAQLPENRE